MRELLPANGLLPFLQRHPDAFDVEETVGNSKLRFKVKVPQEEEAAAVGAAEAAEAAFGAKEAVARDHRAEVAAASHRPHSDSSTGTGSQAAARGAAALGSRSPRQRASYSGVAPSSPGAGSSRSSGVLLGGQVSTWKVPDAIC